MSIACASCYVANSTYQYTLFSLPPSNPLPSASPLTLTFVDTSYGICSYQVCAKSLAPAPEDFTQWQDNCGINYFQNITTNPFTNTSSLPPGPAFFSIYSTPKNNNNNSITAYNISCSFTLTVTAQTVCTTGEFFFQTACQIPFPINNNRTNNNITRSITGTTTPLLTISPTQSTTALLSLNFTVTNADGSPASIPVLIYVRESAAPSLSPNIYDMRHIHITRQQQCLSEHQCTITAFRLATDQQIPHLCHAQYHYHTSTIAVHEAVPY